MNSRERVIAALERRSPDRVPLMELWIDSKVVNEILPGGDSNALVQHLGLDVVTVPTMVYEEDEVEWVDRAHGVFRDKWGALQTRTEEAVPVPTNPSVIETAQDLASYSPPDPRDSPVPGKVRDLRRRCPDKAIAVIGEAGSAGGREVRRRRTRIDGGTA